MRAVSSLSRQPSEFAQALAALTRNRKGTVTLTHDTTTTTVTDPILTPDSVISFDPLTLNAAAEVGAGTMCVLEANRLAGSFIITHANAASTDRKFRWCVGID